MLKAINHIGMALFVFTCITGVFLWQTGNLHLGPVVASAIDAHAGDGSCPPEMGRTKDAGDWCNEHGVAESVCTRCNPRLIAQFKAKGDWCGGHGLPESQCMLCNPGLANSAQCNDDGCSDDSCDETAGNQDEPGKKQCEHGISIVECDKCRYEVGMVKVDPAVTGDLVKSGPVVHQAQDDILRLNGEMQFDQTRTVDVVPVVDGRVEEVKKQLGQKVKKGDILAVIYSAQLGQIKAEYLERQAKLELVQATYDREKELYEQKICSQADYLAALNELNMAKASFAANQKRLQLYDVTRQEIAEMKSKIEDDQFARFVLRAPRDGTIVAQNISAGKLVTTSDTLYTIAELDNLWIWCDLYEKDLAKLQEAFLKEKSLPAQVCIAAYGDKVFIGVIDLIGNTLSPDTRTVKVRVQVKNQEGRLKAGMYARVTVLVSKSEPMTLVPQTAILKDQDDSFVFVQSKDNLWVRKDVQPGRNYNGYVELLTPLAKDTLIVTQGAFMLKSDVLRAKMGAGCCD